MMAALLAWLLQDVWQVLAMGFMLVPEIFLLVVIYRLLRAISMRTGAARWIWAAWIGGMVWDFRWAELPGVTAVTNTLCAAAAFWLWRRTPTGGRGPVLFAMISGGASFASGLVHYAAWAVPSAAAVRMFAAQQCLSVIPIAAITTYYAVRASREHHV